MGKLSGLVGHVNLIAANFRSFPAKPEEQELSSISSNVGSNFLQPEGNSDHIHQYDLSILVEQFCPLLLSVYAQWVDVIEKSRRARSNWKSKLTSCPPTELTATERPQPIDNGIVCKEPPTQPSSSFCKCLCNNCCWTTHNAAVCNECGSHFYSRLKFFAQLLLGKWCIDCFTAALLLNSRRLPLRRRWPKGSALRWRYKLQSPKSANIISASETCLGREEFLPQNFFVAKDCSFSYI